MVQISASMVKELRDKSGAAMMDCKKALVESSGDFDKAIEWLRKKGVATAGKKSQRATSEGLIVGQVSDCGKQAVIVEVNCETDFVAKNEQFSEICNQLAEISLKNKCKSVEELKNAKGDKPVEEILTEGIAKTGENIQLARVEYLELDKDGVIGLYIHKLGGKMGALLELKSDKAISDTEKGIELARELAMHIVSTKPEYLTREDVPKEVIDEEYRIESSKSDLEKKPPEIREKIVKGRVDKILAEKMFCRAALC